MTDPSHEFSSADWRRICDALSYLGCDLLWAEMDCCLDLADRLSCSQLPPADQAD